jgi:hypothetical protein
MTTRTMTNLDGLPTLIDRYDALSCAHEAGHAVVREVLGLPYSAVKLADNDGPARTETPPRSATNEDLIEREIMSALAGGVAEARVFKRALPYEVVAGALADIAIVRDALGDDASNRAYFEELLHRTQELVERNLPKIRRVSKALWAKGKLTPAEVRDAYADMPGH